MSEKESSRFALAASIPVTGELPPVGSDEFAHWAGYLIHTGRAAAWRTAEGLLHRARRLAAIEFARAKRGLDGRHAERRPSLIVFARDYARKSDHAHASSPATIARLQSAKDVLDVVHAHLEDIKRRLRHRRDAHVHGFLLYRLAEQFGRDPSEWIEHGFADGMRDLRSVIEWVLHLRRVRLSDAARTSLRASCDDVALARRWLERAVVARMEADLFKDDALPASPAAV